MDTNKNQLEFDTNYDQIQVEDVLFDSSNTVISSEDLLVTPFDVIRATAKKLGHDIKDPNPSCKSCYGRGYTGRDASNKAPIPCKCIYDDFNSSKNENMYNRTRKPTRKERRERDRKYMKQLKRGTL